MEQRKKEWWVGFLIVGSLGSLVGFLALLGGKGFFDRGFHFHVLYHFAGGIEAGAPVRVSGIKVGQVKKIEFLSEKELEIETQKVQPASVKLLVDLDPKLKNLVRADSQFYINIAGVIGERYLEITPGTQTSPILTDGAEVRGIDPPRVDQLLSQGYGVFGRIQEFLEKNEQSLQELLETVHSLLKDTNSLLGNLNRKKVNKLLENVGELAENSAYFSRQVRGKEGERFVDQLKELVDRAHQIDKPTLKQFLQEEGVRARIF